ncbi:hypothetical protein HY493_01195 [Candidatus Woesearchaeota archaeon]|nr:hypothetical protein [Candidatus Woesearchaeota archaeon]
MSSSTAREGQLSIELVPLVAIAASVLIVFITILAGRFSSVNQEQEQQGLHVAVDRLHDEIRIAATVHDGYVREFTLPATAGGRPYSITIINEHVIRANTSTYEASTTTFNVTGQPAAGENIIRKDNGAIDLN